MKRIALALALAAAAAIGAGAYASSTTQDVHGHLVSHALTSGCASPVGLCTAGRLEGVVNGDFVFTADKLEPSDTPGVFFYTGHIVVDTSRGQLTCQDAGAYSFADPTGPVVDLCTIVGGTEDWAATSGTLRIHGVFTSAGGGDSRYEGTVTR
jgi:hypothetical protein